MAIYNRTTSKNWRQSDNSQPVPHLQMQGASPELVAYSQSLHNVIVELQKREKELLQRIEKLEKIIASS